MIRFAKPALPLQRRGSSLCWVLILGSSVLLNLRIVKVTHAQDRQQQIKTLDANRFDSQGNVSYLHQIPRIIHHIWFKNITHDMIHSEPVELSRTCLDINCVGAEGGWKAMHWDEVSIEGLVSWPLIRHLWERGNKGHPHMMSDIARLAILWEFGGAYLDSDVACYKPFDMLLESPGLRGATMVGGQEINGYLINGIVFASPRHPFIGWMLDALQRRPLGGEHDWMLTGPLVWSQEMETFAQVHPDLVNDIRILPPSIICPLQISGRTPKDFSVDRVWTINYYPSSSEVPIMRTFELLMEEAVRPRCNELHKTSHKIDQALSERERAYILQNAPSRENLVPINKIRTTP